MANGSSFTLQMPSPLHYSQQKGDPYIDNRPISTKRKQKKTISLLYEKCIAKNDNIKCCKRSISEHFNDNSVWLS